MERVTAQQVARIAGVSVSAVSRTYTKGASVSAKTRSKVLAAAKALGYRPNQLARSLMTGRTELVGLVSNHFANPAFMEVFDLFTRRLQQQGLRPLLANLAGEGSAQAALDMMLQYQVDAVLIATSSPPAGFARACSRAGLPVLHIFGRAVARGVVPVVAVDNLTGGRLVAEAMLTRGFTRMAFVGGPRRSAASVDRLKGFMKGLATAGLVPVSARFTRDYSHEQGRLGAHAMFDAQAANAPVQAIFCSDDILALGTMDACRERGLTVPDDVSIVGFDDIPMAGWPSFRLTTVRQPIVEMVDHAIEQIAARLAQPSLKLRTRLFECSLVERGSLRG